MSKVKRRDSEIPLRSESLRSTGELNDPNVKSPAARISQRDKKAD